MGERERVAYVNGEVVPESRATISVFDHGYIHGDAVYDTERTFNGKIFRLEEHIDRLFDSCRYVSIDPGLTKTELVEATLEVVEANVPLLGPDEDYWVSQRVSRGVSRDGYPTGPTVVIESTPLPLRQRARYYRDGIPCIMSSVRRTSPSAISPRAKTHNYLNFVLANIEALAVGHDVWALLQDENGNLCEGLGSNVFVVRRGELLTPHERYVLPGISRRIAMDLARDLGVPVREADIDLYDALTAEEVFFTSTSLCLCGVSSINGRRIGAGFPGPLTARLLQAYNELVGLDIAGQYLAHLEEGVGELVQASPF